MPSNDSCIGTDYPMHVSNNLSPKRVKGLIKNAHYIITKLVGYFVLLPVFFPVRHAVGYAQQAFLSFLC